MTRRRKVKLFLSFVGGCLYFVCCRGFICWGVIRNGGWLGRSLHLLLFRFSHFQLFREHTVIGKQILSFVKFIMLGLSGRGLGQNWQGA